MKKFFIYLMAAIVIGIVIFTISYWVFSIERHIAISLAFSGAITALIVEYLKPYFIAQEKKQEGEFTKE